MPRPQAESQLRRMVAALCHEQFYETGTWINESLGIYVGWIVRKGSFSGGMPLYNERQDIVLIFSGEEFSDVAPALRRQQDAADPNGPSYLVSRYEEDTAFPANLNGRFHGLLVDCRRGTALLFNDRYGMHRIYCHESDEAFYFAAEAKAILAVRPELRRLNPRSLGEFIACGCVLEDRTLFEGIELLPPASAWSFGNASLQRKIHYFNPQEWEDQSLLDSQSFYEEFRGVFSHKLPRYFNGREPVAMSLTGGLDTRMIMAWHNAPPTSLSCYTFGGTLRDCQDVLLARQVARACDQPHIVITAGEDFLSHFPAYAERAVYLTDGCVTVNRSTDLYLNERARDVAPVRMTGNYGGEVLRRVRAFKPVVPTSDVFCPELLSYVHQAQATYAEIVQGHPLSFAVFRQAPWHHAGLLGLEQTQLTLRSPYLDNDVVRTVFRAPDSACANNDICLRLIADGEPRLGRIRTDRGLAGDRHGLSAALFRRYMEFTFKAEYAYDQGMPQWLAQVDHLFSPLHLDRLFLGRHKFSHFRLWYRDVLSSHIREMLLDSRALSRPYLNSRALEDMVSGHTRGTRNYTSELHMLLTLEFVHRLFVDSSGGSLPANEKLSTAR